MPKEKPLQGKPIRGGATPTITETGFSGQVPERDVLSMEGELRGLKHGEVSLTVVVRDGRFQYSRLSKVVTRNEVGDEQ